MGTRPNENHKKQRVVPLADEDESPVGLAVVHEALGGGVHLRAVEPVGHDVFHGFVGPMDSKPHDIEAPPMRMNRSRGQSPNR